MVIDIRLTGLDNPSTHTLFEETNLKVEKFTKTFFFIHMKIMFPFFMALRLAISFFMYFTTDAENDAFNLLLPFW